MKIFSLIIFLAVSTASAQNMDSYVASIEKAKIEVESNIERTPYQKVHQDSFKAYFIELGSLVEDLDNSDKFKRRYQSFFETQGAKDFCKSLFLDKTRWNELVKKCTKNRFFLCAEEVKAFPAFKEAMRDRLTDEMKAEFSKEASCEL
jgi:hypothetical protein